MGGEGCVAVAGAAVVGSVADKNAKGKQGEKREGLNSAAEIVPPNQHKTKTAAAAATEQHTMRKRLALVISLSFGVASLAENTSFQGRGVIGTSFGRPKHC